MIIVRRMGHTIPSPADSISTPGAKSYRKIGISVLFIYTFVPAPVLNGPELNAHWPSNITVYHNIGKKKSTFCGARYKTN